MFLVRSKRSPDMPQEFWEWYESRVHELELNDNKVAQLAKISNSVISKAKGGMQAIGYEALAKIAPVLKTPIATAYAKAGYIEQDQALTPEKVALLQDFDDLSDDDQEEVLAIIRVRAQRGKRRGQEKVRAQA